MNYTASLNRDGALCGVEDFPRRWRESSRAAIIICICIMLIASLAFELLGTSIGFRMPAMVTGMIQIKLDSVLAASWKDLQADVEVPHIESATRKDTSSIADLGAWSERPSGRLTQQG